MESRHVIGSFEHPFGVTLQCVVGDIARQGDVDAIVNEMIGGTPEAFRRLEPVFQALAPPDGYAHVGPSGAGHFVTMIHNAIEYAMLQALGERFDSRVQKRFAHQVIAALRKQFGGHPVRKG